MLASVKAHWRRLLVVLAVLVVLQATWVPAADASSGTFQYVVQRGDTLARIACRFHTTVSALLSLNCICNPNLIFPGQVLLIPCATTCPAACVTTCVTTCTTTCTSCVCPSGCIYIVQRGDTLAKIARCFGTTVHRLMLLNGICNPNLIRVGQRLRVC